MAPLRDLLSRKDAAAYLTGKGFPTTEIDLRRYYLKGGGPPILNTPDGDVYRRSCLNDWLNKTRAKWHFAPGRGDEPLPVLPPPEDI